MIFIWIAVGFLATLLLIGAAGAVAACMLSSRISRQEEAAAMQTEAVAAGVPVHLETLLDNSCGEICKPYPAAAQTKRGAFQ